MLTRRHCKSIHFHLFIFINVVATIVIFGCLWNPFRNFICNIMLLANWQANYIHTYQIWFQILNFSIASYNGGQNLWNNVKKLSKIGQDRKTLKSVFASFLTTSTKFLFAEGRLGTRLCLLPFLWYSQYFLIS